MAISHLSKEKKKKKKNGAGHLLILRGNSTGQRKSERLPPPLLSFVLAGMEQRDNTNSDEKETKRDDQLSSYHSSFGG